MGHQSVLILIYFNFLVISLIQSFSEKIEKVIEEDDITIYCFRNVIVGKCLKQKSTQIEGISVIVLRRQADGNYLVSMDCPWGASLSF
jgi:hypothetical protein